MERRNDDRVGESRTTMTASRPALLVLADGSLFEGEAIGADVPVASGEVVFHTGMSGYQEVMTDPSYAGQIITFTTPHIGNYGVARHDNESNKVFARGVIIREMARRRSNWRSDEPLEVFLRARSVGGITGVDTRRLTRLLRDTGSLLGAFGSADEATLRAALAKEKGTAGRNLVAQVSTLSPYDVANTARKGVKPFSVVAYDFGIKRTILSCLSEIADVHVVPWRTPAAEVMARKPDGVFLSNGPGDPEMVIDAPGNVRDIIAAGIPLFGICLGHQLLGLALGGRTFKLPYGHHGANHLVRDVVTGKVEITSQNHNFCIDPDSVAHQVSVTHVNLNDQTNEGMSVRGARAFSVQYHPEAGPGPHDSRYLFDRFADLMRSADS